jgi:hypothetical protein
MTKVMSPYIDLGHNNFERRSIDGKRRVEVWYDSSGGTWRYSVWDGVVYFSQDKHDLIISPTTAKTMLDADLIEAGYVLLTKEQYDKLKTLL